MGSEEARATSIISSEGNSASELYHFSIKLPSDIEIGDVIDVTYSKRQTKARGLKYIPVFWGKFQGVLLQTFGDSPTHIRVRFSFEDQISAESTIDLERGLEIECNVAVIADRALTGAALHAGAVG